MSPASVSNFVGDLVAMATAFERLPQVEADLADARNTINAHLNTIQRLEHKLLDRANDLTDAQSRIRSLEVERDDAQFHALEADDRTQRALDFIKATFGNAGTLIQALEPPAKPATPDVSVQAMPEAKEAAESEVNAGPNVYTSTASPSSGAGQSEPNHPDGLNHGEASAPEVAPMQASPTSATTPIYSSTETAAHTDASSVASTSTEPAPSSAPFSAPPIDRGKYHGLTYSEARDHFSTSFTWPSKDEWLSDGGTLDNFYA